VRYNHRKMGQAVVFDYDEIVDIFQSTRKMVEGSLKNQPDVIRGMNQEP
jgi:hypothetical protein